MKGRYLQPSDLCLEPFPRNTVDLFLDVVFAALSRRTGPTFAGRKRAHDHGGPAPETWNNYTHIFLNILGANRIFQKMWFNSRQLLWEVFQASTTFDGQGKGPACHLDTTITMRFAPLCTHFPLLVSHRCKPATLTPLTPPSQCDLQLFQCTSP